MCVQQPAEHLAWVCIKQFHLFFKEHTTYYKHLLCETANNKV